MSIALIILAILYIVLITIMIINTKQRKSELSEQLKDLTLNVNKTAKTTLINSPFPLVIMEVDGNIIWKSEKFSNEFQYMNKNSIEFVELLANIKKIINISDQKKKGKIETEIEIKNKTYKILGSYIKTNKDAYKDSYTFIIYFIDQTEIRKLQQ